MEVVLKILFAPLVPFVGSPERCAVVAGVGAALAVGLFLARRPGRWLMLTGSVAWALFAIWERYCREQGYNIRVDLFILGPILLALSLGMLVVMARTIRDLVRGTAGVT